MEGEKEMGRNSVSKCADYVCYNFFMSDYTIEMFCTDHDHLLPILQAVQVIELIKDEWPKFNIEGTIYALNPNFPEVDTLRFFKEKYGNDKGFDYSWRFLEIMRFINKHRENLIKDTLLKASGSQSDIADVLLKMLLGSFSPAKPPMFFPKSALQSQSGGFNYNKVLKATKATWKE